MKSLANRACVESLENRQLFAATPLPSVLGDFVGTVVTPSGTATVEIDITKQKGGALTGVGALSTIETAGRVKGSINKKGVIHLTASGSKASASFVGSLSGDTLTGTLKYHAGKSHGSGALTASRAI